MTKELIIIYGAKIKLNREVVETKKSNQHS